MENMCRSHFGIFITGFAVRCRAVFSFGLILAAVKMAIVIGLREIGYRYRAFVGR